MRFFSSEDTNKIKIGGISIVCTIICNIITYPYMKNIFNDYMPYLSTLNSISLFVLFCVIIDYGKNIYQEHKAKSKVEIKNHNDNISHLPPEEIITLTI